MLWYTAIKKKEQWSLLKKEEIKNLLKSQLKHTGKMQVHVFVLVCILDCKVIKQMAEKDVTDYDNP